MFANKILNTYSSGGNRVGLRWQSSSNGRLLRGYLLNDTFLNYSNVPPYGIFPAVGSDVPLEETPSFNIENGILYYEINRHWLNSDNPEEVVDFHSKATILPEITNNVITGYTMTKIEGVIDGCDLPLAMISLFGQSFYEVRRALIYMNSINISEDDAIGTRVTYNNKVAPSAAGGSAQWDCYTPWDAGPSHETYSATFGHPRIGSVICSDGNAREFVICTDLIISEVRNEWYIPNFENIIYKLAVIPRSYISYIPV